MTYSLKVTLSKNKHQIINTMSKTKRQIQRQTSSLNYAATANRAELLKSTLQIWTTKKVKPSIKNSSLRCSMNRLIDC